MKKQLCAFAVATLFGLGLTAGVPQDQNGASAPQPREEGGHGRPSPERQAQMLAKRLNLSADQEKQLVPILTDTQQQVQSVRSDNSLSADQRREKLRSIRDANESKIKGILTDSQKQAYDQMMQQRRERMREHQEQAPPASPNPQ